MYISVYLSRKVNANILKNENDEKDGDSNINYFRYLFFKEIYLILIGFSVCMINVTFYFPCLTNHLTNNYSLTVSKASLFFIIPRIPYIIILLFLDKISSIFGIYLTFTSGLILSGISSLFIYPVSPLPHSLFFIIVGSFMIGTGSVPVLIPGLVMLSQNIKNIDKNIDELSANDIAMAVNNIFVELGDFLGPILGGFLTDKFGFNLCCFFIGILGIFNSLIYIFFFFDKIKKDFNMFCQNKKTENGNNNELKKELFKKDNYIQNIKENFSFNKYKIISHSFKNKEKENNLRISLYSSITE